MLELVGVCGPWRGSNTEHPWFKYRVSVVQIPSIRGSNTDT